jgi:poly-beta-1,6-N-acetyl-D-glucosamine synthase
MEVVFWLSLFVIFYAFIGYGILLTIMVRVKRLFAHPLNQAMEKEYLPLVSLIIPCYNEADIIREKVLNSLSLDYPREKLGLYFITDGSNDHFREVLEEFPEVILLHQDRRAGKTAAENRAMRLVSTPIVVFSDANTFLNKAALKNIVRHFADPKVGCVSGEKRVRAEQKDEASTAGEGMYWKYESYLKRLDSELYSAVGAAGELVAFRSSLYQHLPEDTLLDDFMQSMLIASQGYRIVYEPEAYALEEGSASVKEELKRKIRIGAGGWQSMYRLLHKITPWKQPSLYFQYLSHRVLRWAVTPILLVLVFILNLLLLGEGAVYTFIFIAQILFYLAAGLGYGLETRKLRWKFLFFPYYFCVMNYAVLMGLFRFLKGSQKGAWEKALRKKTSYQ